MAHLLDQSLYNNREKQFVLNDLLFCIEFAQELFKNAKIISSNNQINTDLQHWLMKHESHKEKLQKIFYNQQHEWRNVLKIVPYLMENYINVLELSKPKEIIFDMTLDIIRSLSLCINPKRLLRYWPTEVKWLIPVIEWNEEYLNENYDSSLHFSSANVLILWLSSAVKTPFDLSRFDNQTKISNENDKIMLRIEKIIESNICNHSLISVLHFLVRSFYSRHDCQNRLENFINKLLSIIKLKNDTIYAKLCTLRILATLLKSVDRHRMLAHVDNIVSTIIDSIDIDHEQLVKLVLKICGRSILVHLKPSSELKWRYKCGKRIIQKFENEIKQKQSCDYNEIDQNEDEFDQDLPEYFETILQILLQNLVFKSIPVRFSSAKYLSSICSRLPSEYSRQIVDHIIEYCRANNEDHYWHGSCLALAEFVRRGLIPIDSQMSEIINIVTKALFYEQIQGSFVAGANVRDAACYICWSMARAYDGQLIGSYVKQLAPILLNVCCFDRQLNCRRAASAVIQELAGRTQQFPHWIDVIQRTEFNALNQIENTYLEIGYHFAITYDDFRSTIVDHLLAQKCIYWDSNIRYLASKTVAKIAENYSFYNESYFGDFLQKFDQIEKFDLNHQHGLMLTASYLLNSDKSIQNGINIIDKFYEKFSLQYDSNCKSSSSAFTSNMIRESLLIFVENCIQFISEKNLLKIEEFLFNSIDSIDSNESIQSIIVNAAHNYMCVVTNHLKYQFLRESIQRIQTNYDQFKTSTLIQFVTRYICSNNFNESFKDRKNEIIIDIINSLKKYHEYWFENELRRPETIADLAKCLLEIVSYHYQSIQQHSNNKSLLADVHQILLKCFDDHTITKKGNTGLIIRRICIQTCLDYCKCIDSDELLQIIKLITTEVASIRGFTFRLSLRKLLEIFNHICNSAKHQNLSDEILNIKSNSILKLSNESIDNEEDLKLFKQILNLFDIEKLVMDLWCGFVLIISDPTYIDRHTKLIIDYVNDCDQIKRDKLLEQFLIIADINARSLRLSIPILISSNIIITRIETNEKFHDELVKIAWKSSEKSSNIKKYLHICDIYCNLLMIGRINLVQGYLYVLLGHRLSPRIRNYTAQQMYTSILSLDIDEPEKLMKIGEILQQTDWNNLNEAKQERDNIRNLIKSL